jgi:hypothetical protein
VLAWHSKGPGKEESGTYGGDSLHAEHKGVLGQVARVAQAVLLPQLAEQILHAAHGAEVVGEVALEKGVDAAAQDEPHDGREVAVAERGPDLLDEAVRDAKDDDAAGHEHADQLERVPFVQDEACDGGANGVVRVVLPREEGEVAGCHCAGALLGDDANDGRWRERVDEQRRGRSRLGWDVNGSVSVPVEGAGFSWTQQRDQAALGPVCPSPRPLSAKRCPAGAVMTAAVVHQTREDM